MRLNYLAFAGKSLLAPALLLPLAACGEAAAPVEEETPAAETAAATPAPVNSIMAPTVISFIPSYSPFDCFIASGCWRWRASLPKSELLWR